MAVVAPFRALRYAQERVGALEEVVTPPYDVIDQRQQQEFYHTHPHNIIRVELNRTRKSDTLSDNRYSRSAGHFNRWRTEGVLQQDENPGFYINETTYVDAEGQTKTRKGFFTLLKVEDFASGVVLPHELTFTGHKEDRLKLTQAVGANVSPIFALYPDDENQVQAILDSSPGNQLLNDFVDPMGLPQKLYAVEDLPAIARVKELMLGKRIFIADGHHRYETAVNFRESMRNTLWGADPKAAFNYTMCYLCSMSDPGLVVFPCHRMVPHLHGFAAKDFLALATPYFDIKEIPLGEDPVAARKELTQSLAQEGKGTHSIGMVSTDADCLYLLTLKPGSLNDPQWYEIPEPLRALDVVVLTHVVLEKLLGLDNNARDLTHTIEYLADGDKVVRSVKAGKARVAFLLNPTLVEQVRAVAREGLIMPRKSTYFYPKVLTGLTMNPVGPGDTVDC